MLVDIDSQNEIIDDIVKTRITPVKIDESIINKLDDMKVSLHWFLDADYSDEFDELLSDLKTADNLDKLVTDYKNKVFFPEEKQSWINKLIFCAYVKYIIGKEDEAGEIYSLTLNEMLFDKLITEILKRSIYEYLFLIKYNKDLNTEMFTDENISDKIAYIEKNWVKS